MLFRIETLTTVFLTVIILLSGCAGCAQKNALKGIEPTKDYNEQSKYGPVAANTRKQAKLKPFLEPSFENLIEQFKADVAANRGNPGALERKRKAIANPNILDWPFFVSAGDYKKGEQPLSKLYRYETITIKTTAEQEKRLDALRSEDLPSDVHKRKRNEIYFGGVDSLTAAKYFMTRGSRNASTYGVEYAEHAMRENPNSVEAIHVWARCSSNTKDKEKGIAVFRKMLSKFPNAAAAHIGLAQNLFYQALKVQREFGAGSHINLVEEALHHTQTAIQLDSRIPRYNYLLARCYFELGEWEKTLIVYHGMPSIGMGAAFNLTFQRAHGNLAKQRGEYSLFRGTE